MTATKLFANSLFGKDFLLLDEMFKAQSQQQGFPYYNIIKNEDEHYTVQVSLAGYDKKELNVTLEEDILVIKSDLSDTSKVDNEDYIFKGISKKEFTKRFRLVEHTQVEGVTFKNGILSVKLKKLIPEEKKPKKFDIL